MGPPCWYNCNSTVRKAKLSREESCWGSARALCDFFANFVRVSPETRMEPTEVVAFGTGSTEFNIRLISRCWPLYWRLAEADCIAHDTPGKCHKLILTVDPNLHARKSQNGTRVCLGHETRAQLYALEYRPHVKRPHGWFCCLSLARAPVESEVVLKCIRYAPSSTTGTSKANPRGFVRAEEDGFLFCASRAGKITFNVDSTASGCSFQLQLSMKPQTARTSRSDPVPLQNIASPPEVVSNTISVTQSVNYAIDNFNWMDYSSPPDGVPDFPDSDDEVV